MLERDGVPPAQRRYDRSLDIKYVGQGYTLNIPIAEAHFTLRRCQPLPSAFTPGMTHCMAFAPMLSQ